MGEESKNLKNNLLIENFVTVKPYRYNVKWAFLDLQDSIAVKCCHPIHPHWMQLRKANCKLHKMVKTQLISVT